jgi:hypothetical protein
MRVVSALILAFGAQMSVLSQTPEQQAIRYLSEEVPRWFRENQCMSCHNNGDGARALYAAVRLGYKVSREALSDTTEWVADPSRWDENRGSPAFSDKKLARIQFAASLTEAYDAGFITSRSALIEAAKSLLPYQENDGAWEVDTEVEAGSPATYGTVLATYVARRTLERAGTFANAVAKANQWLRAHTPRSVLDAAALLLALPDDGRVKQKSLEMILPAQTSDGGWGPQTYAPAEPFDTAIVLLALQNTGPAEAVARGRAFLIRRQEASGGWPETTRPPGAQSYAQHISTSGWATLALFATDTKR